MHTPRSKKERFAAWYDRNETTLWWGLIYLILTIALFSKFF